MKQQIFSKRWFASLSLTFMTTLSWAYNFSENGIYYGMNWDGSVYVTYKDMNFSSYSGNVTIPSTIEHQGQTYRVTGIGRDAFAYCYDLTSVSIPNSVTSIDSEAFLLCSRLTSVSIPNSVTSIGYAAFSYSGLKSVAINSSVLSIDDGAFSDCDDLTIAEFASIENLCNMSFGGYGANPLYYAHHLYINGQKVKNLVIPNSVSGIGDYTFCNCSALVSVTIPNSVTRIGEGAFWGCENLSSINIPNSVSSISTSAFSGCTSFPVDGSLRYADTYLIEAVDKTQSSYTIKEGTRVIGEKAFFGCTSLTSIIIPVSVMSADNRAFMGCTSLPVIDNLRYADTYLVEAVDKSKNTYNIKDGTKFIGAYAFSTCSKLTSLKIPESIMSIGENAFFNCSGLSSIIIPNSVKIIENYAFSSCNSLTSITIPNSVTNIGEGAFSWCSNLTSVSIGNGVKSIGREAFYNCSNLTSVSIGSGVTSIGRQAFSYCSQLTTVTLNSNDIVSIDYYGNNMGNIGVSHFFGTQVTKYIIGNSVKRIGRRAFEYCDNLTSITIEYGLTSIGENAFRDCTGLTSVTIPSSVKSIGEEAFYGCSGLKSVTIGNSVTSIGDYAFRGCTSLPVIDNLRYADTYLVEAVDKSKSTYNIKEGTRFIGSEAFFGCSTLTFVNIPNSVESLCYRAFYSCRSLASVTIPSNVKDIGHLVFFDCVALSSLTIPNHVVSIGEYAFANCSGLSSIKVSDGNTKYDSRNNCNAIIETESNTLITGCKNSTIPNGVIKIGNQAFRGCYDLTSITIPSSVKNIDSFVFGNCSGLKSLTCLAIDAPNMGSDVFFYVPLSTVTLYVPAASLNKYKTADQWKEFGNIVGIDPTAVEELKYNKTLKANENAPIYDLMGRRLQQKPASGYYIQGGKKYFVK